MPAGIDGFAAFSNHPKREGDMGEGNALPQTGSLRTALCAVLGLACMFGGIWLSDAQFLGANASEAGTLAMRVCTCAVYCVFFAVAMRFARSGGDARWLFGAAAVLGLALFAVGALVTFLVMPRLDAGGVAWSVAGVLALFAVKTVGAPVSVGLVCLFARLERGVVVRSCTLGMLGAFALYSLISQQGLAAVLGPEGIVVVSGLLLAASLLLAMVGFGGAPSRLAGKGGAGTFDVLAVPGVVKRPIAKVVTPGFVIMLVFSAMMLGFLRNGFTGGDYHNDPVTFAALLVLLAVAFAWRGLRIEHVFYGALLCTAVGILLAPSVAWVPPGAERFMCGLGMALFEVVSWALVVWAARNSIETLRAAAGMRLAATVGHLLGTMVVAVGTALATTPADALFASEQLMVFVYMVLLVVLLKFPGLQAPFAAASDASEYSVESAGAQADGDAAQCVASAVARVVGEDAVVHGTSCDGFAASFAVVSDCAGDGHAGEVPLPVAAGEVVVQPAGGDGAAGADPVAGGAAAASQQPRVPVPLMPGAAVADAAAPAADPVSIPCDTIARTYRLTAREREVLGLIAHGRNMPFMEQELVISRNTLKMHIRHIYTKLDVHSKQEIIDMIEALMTR